MDDHAARLVKKYDEYVEYFIERNKVLSETVNILSNEIAKIQISLNKMNSIGDAIKDSKKEKASE